VVVVPGLGLHCPTWSDVSRAATIVYALLSDTYMGTILSPNECECLMSSRSRDSSLSEEGMVCGLVNVQPKMAILE